MGLGREEGALCFPPHHQLDTGVARTASAVTSTIGSAGLPALSAFGRSIESRESSDSRESSVEG